MLFAVAPLRAEPAALPMVQALHQPALQCKLTGDGRGQLQLTAANPAATPARIDIPAGLICKTAAGDRVIILRGGQLEVAPGGTSDAQIPTAALSSKNGFSPAAAFVPLSDTEAKLDPLLKFLATRTDVPRETSQILALALLEDINFAQWEQFLAPQRAADPPGQAHPTPAEITQAIDALGVLHEIAPGKAFALTADSGLKLRALRNPWCRAKAMQLYGMTIPGDAGAGGGLPPDLGQLLHTKPGDNCPICRMREQMQGPPSDL
jgi:hypothetical protein